MKFCRHTNSRVHHLATRHNSLLLLGRLALSREVGEDCKELWRHGSTSAERIQTDLIWIRAIVQELG